ncbi:MAG: hypothetical protein KF712_04520 [Akkermansiaceae bacterium]|nr:hypothetical protein [Akkermansiaceae bacterium]
MNTPWTEIAARKRATRRVLAALPLRVKVERLDAMRERLDQLRRFKPATDGQSRERSGGVDGI